MKRIVYVATEATPFAASGGLGDVMGALPRNVRSILGRSCEVGVILPLYATVGEEWRRRMKRIYEGELFLAWRRCRYSVLRLTARGVEYFFIEKPQYFDRPTMYGEFDDGERFAFFSCAALDFLFGSDRIPDVLHLNDWQTALCSVYLKTRYASDPRAAGIRTVLTVHNMEYQGKYDPAILSDIFDLHPAHRGLVEYDGCINLLKGGLCTADRVTTVSPRYAEELADPAYGAGLSGIIASLEKPAVGILNGLDTAFFDPEDASVIDFPYTAATLREGKVKNKRAIKRILGLPGGDGIPLLLMVTRLVAAKGIDLVTAVAERLLSLGVQLVVLGSGEERYERFFCELEEAHPKQVRAVMRFDRDLSKKLYAASDLFLMPSLCEPCGLAQMTACRYGAIPVVRSTGGLADSIIPYGRSGGVGFVFGSPTPAAFLDCVCDALSLYRAAPEEWERLCCTAMKTDFSWRKAATRYISLYQERTEET